MSTQETGAIKEEPTPIPLAEFLEGAPPGNETSVTDLVTPANYIFAAPDIQLHCGSDSCNGTMFFRSNDHPYLRADKRHLFYATYWCPTVERPRKHSHWRRSGTYSQKPQVTATSLGKTQSTGLRRPLD